mgnify:CR=1 FL=1
MTDLPANVERCPGMWVEDSLGGDWREGCDDCRRRNDPLPESGVKWMSPPLIVTFWCAWHIEPERGPNKQTAEDKQE